MVATQDRQLRSSLSGLAGVPVIYINKVIMVLEPLSETSRRQCQMVRVIDECNNICVVYVCILAMIYKVYVEIY